MKICSYGVPVNTYVEAAPAPSPAPHDGDKWYCPVCGGDLFGIFRDGSLHLKYKGRSAVVDGVVTITCRKCGVSSKIDTAYSRVTLEAVTTYYDDGEESSPPGIRASKQAIAYAEEHGINLNSVHGTGKDGRILLRDILFSA